MRVRFKNDIGIIEEQTLNDRKAEKIVDIGDFVIIMAYKGDVYYKDVAYGTDEERKELIESEVSINGNDTLTATDLRNSIVHKVAEGANIEEEKANKALKVGKATARGFLLVKMIIPCIVLLLFTIIGFQSGAYLFAIVAIFMLLIVAITVGKNIKDLKKDIEDINQKRRP